EYSLIGPKYVWYGWNLPSPIVDDPVKVYGPQVVDILKGFVAVIPTYADWNDPQVKTFNKTWTDLVAYSPAYLENGGAAFSSNVGCYDCVKVLLRGMHQFLEKNSNFTPEMLASGALNEYFLPSLFADTGYAGITSNPLKFDENGDLE
ncbi:hypothetical protein HDU76_011954, partial [Blyttiomyces sp. JEL0837]